MNQFLYRKIVFLWYYCSVIRDILFGLIDGFLTVAVISAVVLLFIYIRDHIRNKKA